MKALTIWQPWASLILSRAKVFEFRRWCLPESMVGERVVLHAGARAASKSDVAALLNDHERLAGSLGCFGDDRRLAQAMELLEKIWNHGHVLPVGAALGTMRLGSASPASSLFADVLGADEIDPNMWGWPLADIECWPDPVLAKGLWGFWTWNTPAESGAHRCHAVGCGSAVPPKMLMCGRHWRLVPRALQQDVWRSYRPGQENDKQPSRTYLAAADAAIAAVRRAEASR